MPCFNGECVTAPFPTVSVAPGRFGMVNGSVDIAREILARGPVACGVNSALLEPYRGGIVEGTPQGEVDHIVELVGWGEDEETGMPYWEMRNSWGDYCTFC